MTPNPLASRPNPQQDLDPELLMAQDDLAEPEPGGDAYGVEDQGRLPEAGIRNDPLAFGDDPMLKLALAVNFGPEDLAFNRDGELSPAQIDQLETDLRQFYWPMIGGLALLTFLLGGMSALGGQLLALPAALLMVAAVVPALLLKWERERLPERRVQRTALRMDTLSLFARRFGLRDDKALPAADGKPIFAPKPLYKALQANRTYILYYTPLRTWHGYRLLSLEPTEESSAPVKAKHKPKRG